jgi:hypothetical protein
MMFGIYFITRPLQNILGIHPMPLVINCCRQFFLMAFIAPSILVAIFHWVSAPNGAPRSTKFASYAIGIFMATIFVLLNSITISGSKLVASWRNINMYDPIWFQSDPVIIQLVLIHLICQLVSPVGFLLLSAAYVRHRRHSYRFSNIYNLIPKKWKYLEAGLIIFACSFLVAGSVVILGAYYTYVWSIYFVGAIISCIFVMKSIKLPPENRQKICNSKKFIITLLCWIKLPVLCAD